MNEQLEGINLTQTATDYISKFLGDSVTESKGLRLSLGTKGCAGLSYVVEFVEEPLTSDLSFKINSINVYVDSDSYPNLKGLTLDYVRDGFNKKLTFTNPNADQECGCGKSFSV